MSSKKTDSAVDLHVELWSGYDKTSLLQQLLGAGLNISRIVIPRSPKYQEQARKLVNSAMALGINASEIGIRDQFASLPVCSPKTVLLSVRFPLKIPKEILSRYLYAINIHPTLLPRHRGRYLEPILIVGDKNSGVTAHVIDENYDTGPIISQRSFEVNTFDTVASLLRKSEAIEREVIIDAISKLPEPNFRPQTQDESSASEHFEQRVPQDSYIPDSFSLRDALRIVRACNPKSHPAFTVIDGQKVIIQMRRLEKPVGEEDCL